MEKCYINTPVGAILLEGDENGLQTVHFTDEHEPLGATSIPASLQAAAEQLTEYFTGTRKQFDLELNPQGTDFQKEVWKKLLEVPYGATASYGQIARKLGDVKKNRAVGLANGKNPIAIIIPCHRIVGGNGDLTGYAGGLERKKWLLAHEGSALFV